MPSTSVKSEGVPSTPAEGDGLRFLRLALLIIAVGVSCYGLLLYLIAPEQYYRSVGPLLLLPVALVALILLQRGSATAALRVLTFGVWAAVTVAAVFAGGVRAPALAVYPLLIVMAGWLLGLRTGIVMAGLALATSALLALAESTGILMHVQAAPAVLVWLVQAIVYTTAAVLIALVLHRYEMRYRQVRQLGDELADRLGELEVKESELRLLTENIPAFIFHGDGELRCRFANRRYAEFFGFTTQNIIGKHVSDILGEPGAQAIRPKLEAVLSGETVHYRATRRSAADGEEHALDISFVPERDDAGNVAGFYALKLDVTAEVRAQQELTAQHAFQEALMRAQSDAGLAMFIIENGRIVFANDAGCRLYGYTLDEMCAFQSYLDAVHPADRERVGANHARRLLGEKFDNSYRIAILTKSGERREADMTVAYMEGSSPRVLVIMADATERKRIEDELLRSERKFSRVFQHSPIPISITRMADGRFIDVNEAWTRLFGWTRAELAGRNSFDLGIWPIPEDRQAWIAAVQRSARLEGHEVRLRGKDGCILPILFSTEMVELDGEPCLLALSIDLTEQKKAEAALLENEKRLREAQRIAHVGSWELDLALDAFSWTGEIANIYEVHAEQGTVSYADFLKTLPPDEREGFDRSFGEAIRAGRSGEFTYRLRMRDGRIKHVHLRYESRLGDDGRPMKVFGTTQDITEQVLAREEVQRLNDGLEARVAARTAELTAANRELESFAYSISHDLRAPLRGIDGFSHLLAEEYAEKLDATGRDYLERVRRAAQRMGELIDDILELSRVTRQDMRRVRVDLSQIAAEAIEERARVEPGRRVEVSIEPGCIALGDPQLLRVLMQNLLENAWKYSRKADPARIAFGRETLAGETVFFVRDNGVGFDMKYADRLFSPFQRLHKPEEFEGSGIGLATVARVAHRHGGRVWAEASPDQGATLRFTLGR
ncbi:MAG: Adaptive-response sensory-kinase SasA [Rhodocyclaceae bacterium]|nr:Adaptive-response sensory-kinase SasA [Rhodocyclaceae bacterium]